MAEERQLEAHDDDSIGITTLNMGLQAIQRIFMAWCSDTEIKYMQILA